MEKEIEYQNIRIKQTDKVIMNIIGRKDQNYDELQTEILKQYLGEIKYKELKEQAEQK